MPDIAVTPDQRERLRWIQRRLEEDVAYGHVRPCDALDYLLDHAEATDGLADIDADAPELVGETTDDRTDSDGSATVESDADSASASESKSASAAESNSAPTLDTANGETTLNSMMSLLETHDDKWREGTVGDEKYEVDLPDGSTEPARTQDDVRALLFKHYR